MRLTFPSTDRERHARVMHGDDCVLLMLEDADYSPAAMPSIILAPPEAAALGRRLVQQADAARRVHADEAGR